MWISDGVWFIGEYGDVVLVGLVEGVVDDVFFIRKIFEDIYVYLWGEVSLELVLYISGVLLGSFILFWI